MGEKHWNQSVFSLDTMELVVTPARKELEGEGERGGHDWPKALVFFMEHLLCIRHYAKYLTAADTLNLYMHVREVTPSLFTTVQVHMAMNLRPQFFWPNLHNLSTPLCWSPSQLCQLLINTALETASSTVLGCPWNVDEPNKNTVHPTYILFLSRLTPGP